MPANRLFGCVFKEVSLLVENINPYYRKNKPRDSFYKPRDSFYKFRDIFYKAKELFSYDFWCFIV